jgi:hypothetical protein
MKNLITCHKLVILLRKKHGFFLKLEMLIRFKYGSTCWNQPTVEHADENSVQVRTTGADKQ